MAEKPVAAKKKKVVVKAVKFMALKSMMYHPFQHEVVPMGYPGVELEKDNWVKNCITRGLIREVEVAE